MKGSQSQGANSPENNASFNSMNKKEIQPFRPHTISGLSVMPWQPGIMGNQGFMGKTRHDGKASNDRKSRVYPTKDYDGITSS